MAGDTYPVCVACSASFTNNEELAKHTTEVHKKKQVNLTAEGKSGAAEVEALRKENLQLKAELDALAAENAELKEKLGKRQMRKSADAPDDK